jgi:hypothetical protein
MRSDSTRSVAGLRGMDVLAIVGGGGLLALVLLFSRFAAADYGDSLTRNTIRLSLAWYFAALVQMLWLSRSDWAAQTVRGRLARWSWTWGILVFLVHLAMAFHYFHGWSHADAFAHTREISGWGEGLYVSYAFTWLWAGDAFWWWLRPARYAARSPWIDRILHAFMLFIAFNGTVVFEEGAIRWAGVAGFVLLAIASAVARLRHSQPSQPAVG